MYDLQFCMFSHDMILDAMNNKVVIQARKPKRLDYNRKH